MVAEAASWLAICADEAVCCTVPVSCVSEDTVSCTFAAVCSVRLERSWLPEAISWLAVAMLSLESRTCATIEPSPACMPTRARCRSATSSLPCTRMDCERSPPAMAFAASRASSSGWQIERMLNHVVGPTTSTVSATAMANSTSVWLDTSRWRATASSTSLRSVASSCVMSASAASNSATARVLMRLAVVADS